MRNTLRIEMRPKKGIFVTLVVYSGIEEIMLSGLVSNGMMLNFYLVKKTEDFCKGTKIG